MQELLIQKIIYYIEEYKITWKICIFHNRFIHLTSFLIISVNQTLEFKFDKNNFQNLTQSYCLPSPSKCLKSLCNHIVYYEYGGICPKKQWPNTVEYIVN